MRRSIAFQGFWLLCGLTLCFTTGCASKKVSSSPAQRNDSGQVFPNGVYRQSVSLTIKAKQGNGEGRAPQKFDFNGAVQLNPETIRVVVLSHFGTTVAKVEENRGTGEVKSEIYVSAMKKYEPKVVEYYSVLRNLLLMKTSSEMNGGSADPHLRWLQADRNGRPMDVETVGYEKNAVFHFRNYDEHGVPERMLIEHPSFNAEIETSGYEI